MHYSNAISPSKYYVFSLTVNRFVFLLLAAPFDTCKTYAEIKTIFAI